MIRVAVLLLLFCLPLSSFAQETKNTSGVAASLRMYYPKLPLKTIRSTPVEGIFEVVTQKNELLYFAPRTGHIFVGELWSSDSRNLTRESRNRRITGDLDQLPLDKALKIGNGPNQVVEISDPDCPFCRDGSAFFSSREDVTRYIFLFPLDSIHPQAEAKARYILSAKDSEEAYEAVFSGEFDDKPLPAFKDNGQLDIHRQIAARIGVNSTPRYWINGRYVSGTNLQQFEKLLNRK